mmetsp:Transcript_26780/g.59137  ORF Transcript_26780/g.59137 Transcript_26780/m.59137 type:complete len:257 (+) Transcript_26780:1035-1805(+)
MESTNPSNLRSRFANSILASCWSRSAYLVRIFLITIATTTLVTPKAVNTTKGSTRNKYTGACSNNTRPTRSRSVKVKRVKRVYMARTIVPKRACGLISSVSNDSALRKAPVSSSSPMVLTHKIEIVYRIMASKPIKWNIVFATSATASNNSVSSESALIMRKRREIRTSRRRRRHWTAAPFPPSMSSPARRDITSIVETTTTTKSIQLEYSGEYDLPAASYENVTKYSARRTANFTAASPKNTAQATYSSNSKTAA